ncbi:MAG: MFS transporter [Spirochaetaceae bacterium]|nr:MAG: MFS transporter [Spirochaetaceae bacterium]
MEQQSDTFDKPRVKVGRWVLTATVLASAMDFASQSAVNVALPAIQSALQASGAQLLWIVNGYALMLAALILVGGSLGDKLGRKRVFMTGIGLYAAASLASGLAPSAFFLIAARAVQGMGGALMIPGSLALIAAHFPQERRGVAYGTWAAVTTIAMVVGPLIGGFLAEAGLWRVVFLMNLPVATAALIAAGLKVPETRDEERKPGIDWAGAALVTLGLAGLVYGFTAAPALGFAHPRIYGMLAGGFAALIGFVVVERFQRHPMMPLGLFRSRTFSGANLLTFFLYGGLYGYLMFLTLNLIQGQGYRESVAGFAILPFILLLAAISRWSGKLADRFGPRLPLILGPSLVAVSFLLHSFIGLTSGPQDYWLTFFPAVTIAGIGMGFTVAPLTTTVMSSVSDRHAGTASGINNATSRIAAVLAVAVLGSVALFHFGTEVQARAESLGLPAAAMVELQTEAARLGEAAVPPSVPSGQRQEVDMVLRAAFVDTYRLMMLLCMALAAVAALLSALLIGKQRVQPAGEKKLLSGTHRSIKPVSEGVQK